MSKKSKIKIVTLDEAKKRLKNIHNSLLKNGRTMGLRRIMEYKRKMKDTVELAVRPEDFLEIKNYFRSVEQLLEEVEHNRRLKEIVLDRIEEDCDL